MIPLGVWVVVAALAIAFAAPRFVGFGAIPLVPLLVGTAAVGGAMAGHTLGGGFWWGALGGLGGLATGIYGVPAVMLASGIGILEDKLVE